jgi:Kdo2-lipid IVA lauroyltransferase/acyltransferase
VRGTPDTTDLDPDTSIWHVRPMTAPTPPTRTDPVPSVSDRLVDGAGRALIWFLLRLPYRARVPVMGWIFRRILGPVARGQRRISANLNHIFPGLPADRHREIGAQVLDNFGRALIEVYSGPEFVARAAAQPLTGPGVTALDAAHAAGRPVVLVTAHLGNYDAARAALLARGYRVGGFYRPLANPLFNRHYVTAISRIGTPLFPSGREGMSGMVRFLRGGGMLGMVSDHHIPTGEPLDFLGKPALTALSPAELALRYDAELVPLYAIRQPDGLSFQIVVEAPIPHTDPRTMSQILNDSASARVHANMGQWFWLHRRWKGGDQKKAQRN